MTGGKLIMFDGPDGVGKTTQFEMAAQALRERGYKVYTTHQLGGTYIGEALRQVMFSSLERPAVTNLHISLAIYFALAVEVTRQREAGNIVLVDRSPLSLVAYQVFGDGLDEKLGFDACDASLEAFNPDAIIVYDASLETIRDRRLARHKDSDYFEQQQIEYHERTTRGYEAAIQRYKTTVIKAEDSVEKVQLATMQAIDALLQS